MTAPENLARHAEAFRTRVGACWPGTRAVFRGHDLHGELAALDWMELYLLGITGRRFAPSQIRLMHGLWVLTSYPDTRLWNNRVAALAANARSSSVLGLAAAVAVTEAKIFSGGPGIRAIDFFIRIRRALEAGESLDILLNAELEQRKIMGYGRPINSVDERLPPLIQLAKATGCADGPHYQLAFAVEDFLVTRIKPFLKMNYAGLAAALAADMGLTPRQYHLFGILKTLAGIPPCIIEAGQKPEGCLFPTACADIAYSGIAKRPWKARAAL